MNTKDLWNNEKFVEKSTGVIHIVLNRVTMIKIGKTNMDGFITYKTKHKKGDKLRTQRFYVVSREWFFENFEPFIKKEESETIN